MKSCSEEMSWRNSLIFDRSWATSELAGVGGVGVGGVAGETRDDIVGGATSSILSAMSARVLRESVPRGGQHLANMAGEPLEKHFP